MALNALDLEGTVALGEREKKKQMRHNTRQKNLFCHLP